MKEDRPLRWAVLGTGVIANEMAAALKTMGRRLDAVGNRTHEKAAAFGEKYGAGKVYGDFHEMFTDPDIDVIYLTTPHNTHMPYLEQALTHGNPSPSTAKSWSVPQSLRRKTMWCWPRP